MRSLLIYGMLLMAGVHLLCSLSSCRHDVIMGEVTPIDTTGTNPPPDTTGTGSGEECDPDVVYFQQEVLPLLRSSCAIEGCHDAATASDGVILDNYASVIQTADVRAFDLESSDLYEVITESDPDKRMPPLPRERLSTNQINLIATWILQGAENNDCNPDSGSCNTTGVTFSGTIQPILSNKCTGCHSGPSPSGGVRLNTHAGVAAVANDGRLYGAIAHLQGFEPMPQGGDQLPQCDIDRIRAWIDAGAPNN